MPEIVKKTGINRKAWNQRFSRLERKVLPVTNNDFTIINSDTNENVPVQNGDNLNIEPKNVTATNGEKQITHAETAVSNPIILLIALIIIGLIALGEWLYEKYKQWRTNKVAKEEPPNT